MLIGRALRMLPCRHNEARKVLGCTSTVEPRSHRRAATAPKAALRWQHVTFEGTSDGPTRCHSAPSADRHSWMSACADDPWSATRERIGRTALTGRCRRRESIRSNRVRGPIRCSRWTRPNRCSRSTARSPSIRSTKSIRSSATTGTTWRAIALPSVDAPYGPTVESSFTDEHKHTTIAVRGDHADSLDRRGRWRTARTSAAPVIQPTRTRRGPATPSPEK